VQALLLSGRLVDADGGARQRYVLIRDRRVAWVGVSRPPEALAHGAREIVTGPRTWIYPGLLNLHTHAAYNVLPLWHSRKAPFNNRFEWRADADYKREIAGRLTSLRDLPDSDATVAIVSELQAIAGGTTVLDRSTRVEANDLAQPAIVLCRDIGNPPEIGLPAARRVDSIVDYFKPDPSGSGQPVPATESNGTARLDNYAAARDAGHLGAVLVHLAEGRTGFGSNRGVDPYSRREFEALMHHPSMQDAGRVRAVPFNLVHGCGVDVHNPAHIDFLRDRRISLIWSPVSNLLLYGDTLDAERLRMEGINVALGSDWSPSGSKHVWDEAKFARRFLSAIGSTLSDADIFRMVTVNAAQCLGATTASGNALGRVEPGAFADMFLIESPIDSDSALEVFFSTEDRDVLATIVDGVPIYGRRTFLEQFGLPLQNLPAREGSAAADKAVHLPEPIKVPLATAIDRVEDHLKSLDPPVLRSNLLASSDKAYQRRMQRLRSQAESFGWTARQTMKQIARGQPSMNGHVPVPPAAVRVWCGFMAGDNRDAFLDHIGSVFLPSTVMLLRELGLTAYFPAVVPEHDVPAAASSTNIAGNANSAAASCPATVGIAFYESQETYARSKEYVGGRLHDLLHASVFRSEAQGSWSAFPVPLARPLRARTAYHLFDEAVDWYSGVTRLCIGVRQSAGLAVSEFHARLEDACAALQSQPHAIDAALMAIDDDYFVFWDHQPQPLAAVGASAGASASASAGIGAPTAAGAATSAGTGAGVDAHLAAFAQCSRIVMQSNATDANANAAPVDTWNGFTVKGGECYRMVFERRALFPW
jgi:cytosine/adenosine deaminase-related metal-dependent hydrolase